MKKLLALMFCLMLALTPAGCTDIPEAVGSGTSALQTAEATRTPEPALTVTPVPAPSVTPSPTPTAADDLSSVLWLSDEEEALISSLWPLAQYSMADMGDLTYTEIVSSSGMYLLTIGFSSYAPASELSDMLVGYIQGNWASTDDGVTVSDGNAEGCGLDCTLYDDGAFRTIDLRFHLNTRADEVRAMIARHWPVEAISWPDALTDGEPFIQSFSADAQGTTVLRTWPADDFQDILEWYDNRYRGSDSYTHITDEKIGGEGFSFTAKGLKTTVAALSGMVLVQFYGPPKPAESADATVSDEYYTAVTLADGTLNIIDYNGPQGELVIPASIGGVAVTGVSGGFSGKAFTSVTIPEGATFLGDGVFANCTQLVWASLPSTLKAIGAYAFANDTALVSLGLPRSVTIGDGAFANNEKFEDLALP